MSSRVPHARPFVVKSPDSTRANARSVIRAIADARSPSAPLAFGDLLGTPRGSTARA